MEIRSLRASNDRSAFQPGDEALDRLFHRYAGQNQFRHHLGVTYVAADDDRLLGFATVAPWHIDIEDLPDRLRKELPRYGFQPLKGQSEARRQTTMMWLPLQAIRNANEPTH